MNSVLSELQCLVHVYLVLIVSVIGTYLQASVQGPSSENVFLDGSTENKQNNYAGIVIETICPTYFIAVDL